MKVVFRVLVCWVCILLFAFLIYHAVAHNLDRATPIYPDNQIQAFDTPEGRIEETDQQFNQLIESYE